MRLNQESFHQRLFSVLLWLVIIGAGLTGFSSTASAAVYQAESGALTGGATVQIDHSGYTGTGFAGGFTDANRGNAQTAMTVNVTTAGSYTLGLRYANGTGTSRTMSLYVNGTKLKQIALNATVDWNSWSTQNETVALNAGNNNIAYRYDTADSGNANLDSLSVTSAEAGPADLVVTSVTWTPVSPQTGNAMAFSATIKNQGSAATPSIKHGVKFTVDGVQVVWSDNHTSSLAAGASVTLTANGGPAGATWAATLGGHTVQAYVDDQNLIAETNETNNTLSASLTVAAAPSLSNGLYRIRSFWQPTLYLFESGGKVMYGTPAASDPKSQWALVDQGGHKALWNASTGNYVSITGVASSADALTTSYSTPAPNNVLFDLPAASNAGHYNIRSVAQSSWYATIEGQKGFVQSYAISNTWGSTQWALELKGAVPSRPAAKPDLIVTNITWSPAVPSAGQAVTISATIKNQGPGATPAGTTNKISFAVNGTVVTSVSNYSGSLPAGASITLAQDTGSWAMTGSAPTVTAVVDSTNVIAESDETNNAFSTILSTATYGASMPYITYEAEVGSYTGTLVSGSRAWGQLASEASGRAAVKLSSAGQYAQITTAAAGQGLVLRYSIPDTSNGSAYNAGLSLYVNGVKKNDLVLTNKFSWIYGTWGTEGGNKHWSNNPSTTPANPHRFFDEVAVVLDASYPAGTTIKLMRETSNLNFSSTASVTVDFVELEPLPAVLSMPSNFVSITSYGAAANDGIDDTTAMNSAIAAVVASAGSRVGVWIPAGTFDFNNGVAGPGWSGGGTRIYLPAGVSLRGTGIWTSKLQGNFAGVYAKGGGSNLSDLKISADDVLRDDDDGVSGAEGNFSNSTINNVWFEHTKVGVWTTQSYSQAGLVSNATITNCRIRDTWADGLNLHYGTSNSTVSNNVVRNTGDDGLAMWSDTHLNTGNTFQNNTIQLPGLANGIGIYGGENNVVKANLIVDIIDNGGGIQFGTNFSPPSLTGTLDISGNKLVRAGSYHHDYSYNIGAIWEYWVASSGKIANPTITLNNNVIEDSTYAGVLIEEPSTGASVTHTGTRIVSSGTYGVEISATAVGAATFNTTAVSGVVQAHLKNNSSSFTVTGVIP